MDKDAYYFPHFSNARHDRKVRRLIKELGVEGYGIFFMTLEVLREQIDYKYPIDDIDLLADEFGTSEQKLRVVVCNYKLFIVDEENNFFSPKFIEFMQPYLKMKEQRRLAGKASAEKRKQRMLNGSSTTVQQSKVKESKVKESKVKDIKTPVISEKITIPYQDILDLYNSICVSLPKVKILNETRKKRIKSIYLKEAEQNTIFFKELFCKIEKSDFLTGRNSDWNATFDWIIKPANLLKILEDNYKNKSNNKVQGKKTEQCVNFNQSEYKEDDLEQFYG